MLAETRITIDRLDVKEINELLLLARQEPEYCQLMLPQYVIRMVKNPLLLAHGIVHWRKYSPVQQSSFTEQCRYLSEFAKVEAKIAKPKQAERQENPRRRRNKGPLRRQKS